MLNGNCIPISEVTSEDFNVERILGKIFRLTFDIKRLYYLCRQTLYAENYDLMRYVIANDLSRGKHSLKNGLATNDEIEQICAQIPDVIQELVYQRNAYMYWLLGYESFEKDGKHLDFDNDMFHSLNSFIRTWVRIVNNQLGCSFNPDKWVKVFGCDQELGYGYYYSWDCFGDVHEVWNLAEITEENVRKYSSTRFDYKYSWEELSQYVYLFRRKYEKYESFDCEIPYVKTLENVIDEPTGEFEYDCVDKFLSKVRYCLFEKPLVPKWYIEPSYHHLLDKADDTPKVVMSYLFRILACTAQMRLLHCHSVDEDIFKDADDSILGGKFLGMDFANKHLTKFLNRTRDLMECEVNLYNHFLHNKFYGSEGMAVLSKTFPTDEQVYDEFVNSTDYFMNELYDDRLTAYDGLYDACLMCENVSERDAEYVCDNIRDTIGEQSIEELCVAFSKLITDYVLTGYNPEWVQKTLYLMTMFYAKHVPACWLKWDGNRYDIDEVNKEFEKMFHGQTDDYDNFERCKFGRVLENISQYQYLSYSKLKLWKAPVEKKISDVDYGNLSRKGERNPRQGVNTGNTGYNNTPTPADPIKDVEDIARIKEYFLTTGNPQWRQRNYTIFCLGISTGLRASDLLDLRVGDVFNDDGIVDEIVVHEKKTGNLTHTVLNDEIKEVLFNYIQTFDEIDEENWLFPSQSPFGRLQVKSLFRIFKKVQSDLNLSFHFSTHSLRKTFAYWTIRMHYYDQNIIFSLQDMLNHRDIKNTLYYSGHTKDHLKTLYNDMGKVLTGNVEDTPAISSQEQKINQILDMLSKQLGDNQNTEE